MDIVEPEDGGDEPLKAPSPTLDSEVEPGPANPHLDFESRDFDAALALSTAGLQPPVPAAPILDNISKFRPLLPPEIAGEATSTAGQPGRARDADAEVRPAVQCSAVQA